MSRPAVLAVVVLLASMWSACAPEDKADTKSTTDCGESSECEEGTYCIVVVRSDSPLQGGEKTEIDHHCRAMPSACVDAEDTCECVREDSFEAEPRCADALRACGALSINDSEPAVSIECYLPVEDDSIE